MEIKNIVRFGVIGAGNMGYCHIGFFREGKIKRGVVAAIADPDAAKRERALALCADGTKAYADGGELIKHAKADGLDAVIVATPHYAHPKLSISALKRGLHTICEKPAGVYTKQVLEMNKAASESKALFTLMYNQRTNPLYLKMRGLVQEGAVGVLKRVNWLITNWYRTQFYYDSSAWRATWAGEGGGVLLNQCPHQLDLLQWIVGEMPKKIHAFCHFGKWHDIEVEDDVTAYLEYANGATGAFITTTADAPGANRFEIVGTRGKMVCEHDKLLIYRLKEDEREWCMTVKDAFKEPVHTFEEYRPAGDNPQHAGIINMFIDSILDGAPLFVDGREGLKCVQLMDAMLLSSWTGKAVGLPFSDELYYRKLKERVKNSVRKEASDIFLDNRSSYGGTR
jgi:predicted dehydrogenase